MRRLRAPVALLSILALVARGSSESDESGLDTSGFARSVDIGGRSVYLTCHGTAAEGAPTIVLISGYHDSSDVWTQADALDLAAPAVGPGM